MTCKRIHGGVVCAVPTFKPGDPPPSGYLEWTEWAEVQRKAGISQVECGKCGKWKTPQELSDKVVRYCAETSAGMVTVKEPICITCDEY